MPSPLAYQQFCPVGAALNVVGERWALLIVRDLLLGPRRYSELLSGLGGIGTDILAARLRSLQEHGIVRQAGTGRSRHYELTDAGQALRPVLTELARWGADRLELPSDPARIPPRVPLTSLLIGAADLPPELDGQYEFRVAQECVCVEVADGHVRAAPGAEPAATITLTMTGLGALVLGHPPTQIEESADAVIEGDRPRGLALLQAISAPPLLAGLRRRLLSLAPAPV